MNRPSPTIAEALEEARNRLRAAEIEEADLIGACVVSEVSGYPRLELPLHAGHTLTPDGAVHFRRHLERLLRHEPLQYVLGHTSFFGEDILTDSRALIPRPETEVLVEKVVEACSGLGPPIRILDVGTGSGCISIALARGIPTAEIVSVDISPPAIKLAEENVRRTRLEDRITLLESDLLDSISEGTLHDVMVANLPYITESELDSLPKRIAIHEPRIALDGGPSGLDLFRRLIPQAVSRLAGPGMVFLEIGASQAGAVEEILVENGYNDIRVHPDLSGRDRIVAARLTLP